LSIDESLVPNEDTGPQAAVPVAISLPSSPARWLPAAIRTTRPRQWPKNLLVLAAPLAAAKIGAAGGTVASDRRVACGAGYFPVHALTS